MKFSSIRPTPALLIPTLVVALCGLSIGGLLSPASAQFRGVPAAGGGLPPQLSVTPQFANTPAPQPLEIQSLDATHFVVVTREPRLVLVPGRENAAQSMLCTVVTHYTVQGNQLVPVEHVRVPAPYRLVQLNEE